MLSIASKTKLNEKRKAARDGETKKLMIPPFETWDLVKPEVYTLSFSNLVSQEILFKLVGDGFLCCLQTNGSDQLQLHSLMTSYNFINEINI